MAAVSIITVVLNAEKYIEASIKSVYSQSFDDYEHIVFDGFSNDRTIEIINKNTHPRLKLIQEKDTGIYDAMNKALLYATGEWVYFLNAGDLLYDSEVLNKIFTNKLYKKADLLSGQVKTMNDPSGISLISGRSLTLASFYFGIPVSHQGAFIRRSLFNEIGYYHLNYSVVADQEWFVRFFKSSHYKYIYTDCIFAWYETVGFSHNNRLKGLRQMLDYSSQLFPIWVHLLNKIRYPIIVFKVRLIHLLKENNIYIKYRQLRYGK